MVALGAWIPCSGDYCQPLPGWLQPWVVAGAVVVFLVTLAWAVWTVRRRRR